MLHRNYPIQPMSPAPTVLVQSFLAQQALEDGVCDDPDRLDEVATQTLYATHEGARARALVVGGLRGHDQQAAALLVIYAELETLMCGGLTVGGDIRKRLDRNEIRPIEIAMEGIENLLEWHFLNGAGGLLPFADYLGLVQPRTAAR